MFKKVFFCFFCSVLNNIYSQENYNIDSFIRRSEKSLSNIRNEKYKVVNAFDQKLFNKSFLPDFSLNFSLPSYNRSISEVMQPDGSYAFRESNSANSKVNLAVSQKIPLTGGKISIVNSLNRLDLFGDQRSTNYSASWFGINFTQSLTFFNEMKWDNKIQEARYNYNNLLYLRKQIDIKKTTINHYFELVKIKNQVNLINAESISANKYKKIISSLIVAGKKMAYDSIDVELKLLDIQRNQSFLLKSEAFKVKAINTFFNTNFLNQSDQLSIPRLNFEIQNVDIYIERYLDIHKIIEANNLRSLEKSMKQLESIKYYSANLALGVGFNNSADQYQDIFQNPNQSQNFSISLSLPLMDFGKRKTEFEISKTKYEIEMLNLDQDKIDNIERINLLRQEILDLYDALNIEKTRSDLLKQKLKLMEKLLYAQKILYSEYSDIERLTYNSNIDIINLTEQIYNKVSELEEITLLEIIKDEY